jgi:hypothetical protein
MHIRIIKIKCLSRLSISKYSQLPSDLKWIQVDRSEVSKIEIDGNTKKLYCFSMVLGYSMLKYIEFTLTIDIGWDYTILLDIHHVLMLNIAITKNTSSSC